MNRHVFITLHSTLPAGLQSEACESYALYRRGIITRLAFCARLADLLSQS